MDRRRFLASAGLACGSLVAGCLGQTSPGDDPPSGSPTASPGTATPDPTASPTDTPSVDGVEVSDPVVRKAVTYESYMGSGGVLAAEGRQYVVASVRADRELRSDQFVFEAGERSWTAGLPETVGSINRSVAGHGGGPIYRNPTDDGSFVAFEVPSPLDVEDPRIRWRGAADTAWSLPADAVRRLGAPEPRFELADLTVPETVTQGDPLEVSFTARNVSEANGRFLAALYWPTKRIADDDESYVVGSEVAAGDQLSTTVSLETDYTTDETESIPLSVRGHVRAERSVRVRVD